MADQLVFGIEVGLGIRAKLHTEQFELLQVVDGFTDAFSAEAVETPEHQHVELPVLGCFEHLVEAGTLAPPFSARLVVDELASQIVPLAVQKLSELPALVLFGLTSVTL